MFNKNFNKSYGSKIYSPLYNYDCMVSDIKPDIYNKDGQKMDIFFIRDINFAFSPYGYRSKYFLWDRFNVGLKTHFYTHKAMLEQMGNPDKKYGWMIESRAIVPKHYNIFKKHKGLYKDFDAVFTYDDELLNEVPNAKFLPVCAQTWYGKNTGGGNLDNEAFKFKTKNISIVSSDKHLCELHKFRIEMARKCKRDNLADTFGTFDNGTYSPISESLTNYRYSIAVENYISDYFFTEKITNCFASMTIPIYVGARKIGNFFNPDGIITIKESDLDNLENILKQCNEEDYMNRLDAIKDNYNRAKEYMNMDDYLWEKYLSE